MLHELWRLGTHRKLYAMVMLHLLHMQRIQIYVHEADKQLEFELITAQIIIGTNNIGFIGAQLLEFIVHCTIITTYCPISISTFGQTNAWTNQYHFKNSIK